MRDLGNKMAELKFEAPLAQFEETDEWGPLEFQLSSNTHSDLKSVINETLSLHLKEKENNQNFFNGMGTNVENDLINKSKVIEQQQSPNRNSQVALIKDNIDNFTETFSGSLEDLVNTFDDKLTKCFGNYEESVEELAPVQIRTQEEMVNDCQMWWTITGNYGNILPIDWSKSQPNQSNVNQIKTPDDDLSEFVSEDEGISHDMLDSLELENFPIKSADEVIKEIDDIMDEEILLPMPEQESIGINKPKPLSGSPFYEHKLNGMTIVQLNEIYGAMENLIREFSETLIAELACRDELEYEKELKNTFISLLLAVQNHRRQNHFEHKTGFKNPILKQTGGIDQKYLTTVIPYRLDSPPNNQTLQILIKILKAINDDSPTVPTLLTDYILKVLCPK